MRHYRRAMRVPPPTDLDFMADLLGDPKVTRYCPRPKARNEARAWIEWNTGLYRERGFGLWLIEHIASCRPVGNCGLTPQLIEDVEEIELGYHVHPDFQGQGLATEAASAVLDYARSVLDRPCIVAIIDPRIEPSNREAWRRLALWEGDALGIAASRGVRQRPG